MVRSRKTVKKYWEIFLLSLICANLIFSIISLTATNWFYQKINISDNSYDPDITIHGHFLYGNWDPKEDFLYWSDLYEKNCQKEPEKSFQVCEEFEKFTKAGRTYLSLSIFSICLILFVMLTVSFNIAGINPIKIVFRYKNAIVAILVSAISQVAGSIFWAVLIKAQFKECNLNFFSNDPSSVCIDFGFKLAVYFQIFFILSSIFFTKIAIKISKESIIEQI